MALLTVSRRVDVQGSFWWKINFRRNYVFIRLCSLHKQT